MEKEYFRNKICMSLIFSFAFFARKVHLQILLKTSCSKPESGQDFERKLYCLLSRSKTSLETYKVYSEKTVDLKICTSPEKSKKDNVKSAVKVFISKNAKQDGG